MHWVYTNHMPNYISCGECELRTFCGRQAALTPEQVKSQLTEQMGTGEVRDELVEEIVQSNVSTYDALEAGKAGCPKWS